MLTLMGATVNERGTVADGSLLDFDLRRLADAVRRIEVSCRSTARPWKVLRAECR